MDGRLDAVTTSCLPGSLIHESNTFINTRNSSRSGPVYSQSRDFDYNPNRRAPMSGSCSQQERLSKHASFDDSGLPPDGQPTDPSRHTGAYGHSSGTRHGPVSTSPRNTGMIVHEHNPGYFRFVPNKKNCSVGSIPNERYKLDDQSLKEHENEDDFLIYANVNSLCLCVFDGHDGLRGVKFVRKYMKANIFDTNSWTKLSEFDRREEIETALVEFIKVTDADFFKNIRHFIDEKLYVQSQIPKVMNG